MTVVLFGRVDIPAALAVNGDMQRAISHVLPGTTANVSERSASAGGRATAAPGTTVVAIPSRNEASTIGNVVEVAMDGLRQRGLESRSILVNCDNGSTDGTPDAFGAAAAGYRNVRLATGDCKGGKGSNVRRMLAYAADIGADRMLLLDADLRSAEPCWIGRLLSAVGAAQPAMATPVYRRNRFEGNTTNHIASPLMRAVFGVDVQQPIAGDFAFNRAFIRRALTWPVPASANMYGIDIWLTANASRDRIPVIETPLGRKLHNPGFPKILYGSQQVIDSLFHVIARHGKVSPTAAPLPMRSSVDMAAQRPNGRGVEHAIAKVAAYIRAEAAGIEALFPSSCGLCSAPWGLRIGLGKWAELLAESLAALAGGNLAATRDHLVALYFCRVMSYWEEIGQLPAERVDQLLDRQMLSICEAVSRRDIQFRGPEPEAAFNAGYWEQGRQ